MIKFDSEDLFIKSQHETIEKSNSSNKKQNNYSTTNESEQYQINIFDNVCNLINYINVNTPKYVELYTSLNKFFIVPLKKITLNKEWTLSFNYLVVPSDGLYEISYSTFISIMPNSNPTFANLIFKLTKNIYDVSDSIINTTVIQQNENNYSSINKKIIIFLKKNDTLYLKTAAFSVPSFKAKTISLFDINLSINKISNEKGVSTYF